MLLPDNFDELALIGPPATPRQIKYAKKLALDRGHSVSLPQSKVQADVLIDCLLEKDRDSYEDRSRDIDGARDEVVVGVYGTAGWD